MGKFAQNNADGPGTGFRIGYGVIGIQERRYRGKLAFILH